MNKDDLILVCGAGGFIAGHYVKYLLDEGYTNIRTADVKPLKAWYQRFPDVENHGETDLNDLANCERMTDGARRVINLACNMGGMGFIENNKAECMLSVLINTHLLMSIRKHGLCERYFYSSSACAYSGLKQTSTDCVALKEEDAYPAMPEDGYGWEKLFSERMCRHFHEDFGIESRIARFHNVYGPNGTWDGGREKAPAAIARKVIEAKISGKHEIEIWGDGNQTRSFMYIEDCIRGINTIFDNDYREPLNLGSAERVTINQLVDIVEEIAGIELQRNYNLDAPKGVAGRNSDNTLFRSLFDWEPSIPLKEGMEKTYRWIEEQVHARNAGQEVTV